MHQDSTLFNPSTHYLGTLCKRGHDWNQTGKSLRRISNHDCQQCDQIRSSQKIRVRKKAPLFLVDNGDGTTSVPLTQNKFALIDTTDAEEVGKHRWHCSKSNSRVTYAKSRIQGKGVYMHRLILGFPDVEVDHISGDTLDNRRVNLRVATRSENTMNTPVWSHGATYKGVHLRKDTGKWTAYINANSKRIYLGCFTTMVEAAKAYDSAAKEIHGEFARLNFPEE